jgi:hypothetical protein
MILSGPEDDRKRLVCAGLNRLDKIESILHLLRYILRANI